MSATATETGLVLDDICRRLRGCGEGAAGADAPVAILWTDPASQWRPAIDLLRDALPELVELGAYDPAIRRGPAIWVRCVVDRTIAIEGMPERRPPIVYMPGVARQKLRAGEECPIELRPLVELLYRGVCWLHRGGHDLTIGAYLKSPWLLGLDVAEDAATGDAILRAVGALLQASIAELKGRRLASSDFNRMVVDDPIRDLLQWIAAPQQKRSALGAAGWPAFAASVRSEYGFDPESASPLEAAELLCRGEGRWGVAWRRFEEGPNAFPGLDEALLEVDPGSDAAAGLFEGRDTLRYAKANASAEESLAAALDDLDGLSHEAACDAVRDLEASHGSRRRSVWAALGRAPLAKALEPLAALAEGARRPLQGTSPDAVAAAYERSGWQTDAALLDAIAAGDRQRVVLDAARVLAEPWLDQSAVAFQALVDAAPLPTSRTATPIEPQPGECIVFVDGLRYDIAQRLADRLDAIGYRVERASRWAALPTVTATAKPAVSPVSGEIDGGVLDDLFEPRFAGGKAANAPHLRKAIEARGGQLIARDQLSMPASPDAWGWAEIGDIDSLGHKVNERLVMELPRQLDLIAEAVAALLEVGWRSVRVVTDHGWLLLPGGLTKVELSRHLAPTRWARCARVVGELPASVVQSPWHWNPQFLLASPRGIACFAANDGYAHGGVSVQECLIPDLRVSGSGRVARPAARIASVGWVKHRCLVEVEGADEGMAVDLRLGRRDGASVLASGPKKLDGDGAASAPVEDTHENQTLVVVLLDSGGAVLDQRTTRIGAGS